MNYYTSYNNKKLFSNTIFLGGASIVISSLYFCLYKLYDNSRVSKFLLPILGSGYAFPGVVIALGTLLFLGNLQFQINSFLDFFEFNLNFSFIGGFFGLILASYCKI